MANDNASGLVTGLIIGVVVGAAAGLLLAPKSGKENRQYLVDRYNNIMQRIREKRRSGRTEEQAESEVRAELARDS